MKNFNVCTKRAYEINGEKRVKWYRVGILQTSNQGFQYLRLFQQPNTDFYIFEKNNKDVPTNPTK